MTGTTGTGEIPVILFVIILLFGAKRLPEPARSPGKSLSEFRNAVNSATADIRDTLKNSGS